MSSSQFQDIAAHYDDLMEVVPYDFWAEYVMTLFEFVGHQPHEILDCACGTGNLSFELAKMGFKVTGIDLSQPMIEQAKIKTALAAHNDVAPQFFQANLSDFSLNRQFDSATCLYDSLNYIVDNEGIRNAFSCIRRHVRPGGIFVFDFNSVWAFEANLFSQSSRKPSNPLQYDWKARFDEKTRICTVNMHFKRKNADGSFLEFFETHRERAYTITEIETFLSQTDWRLLHTFDAYTLNRPHTRSERWFFVAQAG